MRMMRHAVLLGSILLLLAGCGSNNNHHVRYEVSGTASRITINYTNASGVTEQKEVQGSWKADYWVKTWSFVTVNAFNPTASGKISCRMYIDDVLVQRSESEGGYQWATCSDLAGATNLTPTPLPDSE